MGKHICLLATGGTIACEEGADGLRPVLTGAELLRAAPELARCGEIDVIELCSLDSSNLLPMHWQRMAQAIAERCGQYDGFVLTHGTDTMGYTAGALYYMLRGIGVPVALTGSMLPLAAAGTDARANLRGAVAVAASGRAGGYQAFAGRVISGNAVKKVDSTARDAFRSIGRPQAGTFALADGALTWQVSEEARTAAAKMDAGTQAVFAPQFALDERVAVVKLVPGAEPRLLTALADAGYRAVIIEGYGAGGVPTDAAKESFLAALDYARERDVAIIAATQCVYDGAHLSRYENGVLAQRRGAISGGAHTTEYLFAWAMVELGEHGRVRAALEVE